MFWNNKVDFGVGLEFSKLLKEEFSGTSSHWRNVGPFGTDKLNDIFEKYNTDSYFGIRGKLAYIINLSDTFSVKPQYSFSLGITKEFTEFPNHTRSFRHFIGIGFQQRLP